MKPRVQCVVVFQAAGLIECETRRVLLSDCGSSWGGVGLPSPVLGIKAVTSVVA